MLVRMQVKMLLKFVCFWLFSIDFMIIVVTKFSDCSNFVTQRRLYSKVLHRFMTTSFRDYVVTKFKYFLTTLSRNNCFRDNVVTKFICFRDVLII